MRDAVLEIKEMGLILDRAQELIKNAENAPSELVDYQPEIQRLTEYYESSRWKEDYAADEAGMFPSDLKRGVLSEDGIYNMLESNREALQHIGRLSTSRTQLIYGEDAINYFASRRVAVFGVGGVGGYVVEALARSGIGALDLIDNDTVCLSNINRQIIATRKTVGRYKVDVAKERVHEINPDCKVRTYKTFFLPESKDQFDFREYDYVVDAIDTVSGKLAIIEKATEEDVPVISSMGAGNKVDPAAFEIADIYETSVCPLAKVMRRECRKRNIKSLKVVYSKEEPRKPLTDETQKNKETDEAEHNTARRRAIPGSTAFAPSVAGLIIAGEIINDLASKAGNSMK